MCECVVNQACWFSVPPESMPVCTCVLRQKWNIKIDSPSSGYSNWGQMCRDVFTVERCDLHCGSANVYTCDRCRCYDCSGVYAYACACICAAVSPRVRMPHVHC